MGQAVAVIFDAEATAGAEAVQHRFEVERRVGAAAVPPDADIFDIRGALRQAQIGGAGQQRDAAVSTSTQSVRKKQKPGNRRSQSSQYMLSWAKNAPISLCATISPAEASFPRGHFGGGKMDGHRRSLLTSTSRGRT